MSDADDDWRLSRGQEEYLSGATLAFTTWEPPQQKGRAWRVAAGGIMETDDPDAAPPPGAVEEVEPRGWDHDHCEFCWATLMTADAAARRPLGAKEVLTAGYLVVAGGPEARIWICPDCFEDFRDRMAWSVAEGAG